MKDVVTLWNDKGREVLSKVDSVACPEGTKEIEREGAIPSKERPWVAHICSWTVVGSSGGRRSLGQTDGNTCGRGEEEEERRGVKVPSGSQSAPQT